jgi:FSR family fosmidomycin resistance protein-like MFS transporter
MKNTHSKPKNTGRFQTGGIVALSVSHFIHDVYSGFLSPLLPLLIEKLSMSLTQAGLLSTVMQIPHLANPYIGMLADRVSVRYFVILAPTLTAIPMSLIGVAPTYGVLLILLFVTGISVAVFHVPAPAMVAKLSGPHKGRGMSFFMTGGELARALSPLAAVGAVSLMGLEGFYPVMVVGFATSLWLFFRFKDVPIGNNGKAPIALSRTWRSMKKILIPLAAILTMRGFMHGAMTTFLPTFIALETGNLWLAGIALTVFETAGVAGVLLAGPLSDRFGRRRVLLVSLMGAPVALALLTWTGGWVRYAMMVATGLTLLSTTPVMLAMIQEHATESPSSANGLFMMVSFMARSATVVVIGWLGDVAGLQVTYTIAAAMGILAIPFVLKLPHGNGPQEG